MLLYDEYFPLGLLYMIDKRIRSAGSILDLGCGPRSPVAEIMRKRNSYSVGADVFGPYIRTSHVGKRHVEDVRCDACNLPFAPGSFDVVLALDVLEHLTEEKVSTAITEMTSVARQEVIVLTPNGLLEQEASDGNPHQRHESGITTAHLVSKGFRVMGVRGFKPLRGQFAAPKIRPKVLGYVLIFLTEMLMLPRVYPSLAFQILGVLRKRDLSESWRLAEHPIIHDP
jgi:SAM-dependent methyltransferase